MDNEAPIEVEVLDKQPSANRFKKGWSKIPTVGKAAIAIVIILIVIGAATLSAPGRSLFQEKYHLVSFDADRAYKDHQWFQNLGPRMTGTDSELKGAQYIASQLSAAGLKNVHIEEFEIYLFTINKADVSIVPYGPGGNFPKPTGAIKTYENKIDYVVQGFSGSHAWSNFKDDIPVVDLGNGTVNSTWKSAAGKCGILTNDPYTKNNTVLYKMATENNLACLAVNNHLHAIDIGGLAIFKGVYLEKGKQYSDTLPFFMMNKAMGDAVLADGKNGSKLRLNFDVPHGNVKVRVIIGEIEGREKSSKYVMIGGHSDTVYNGPGQVDNTAGTVTVLELARSMAKERPKRTIKFAFFGGEEEGLHGSIEYVNAHRADLKENLIFYENADMTNIDLTRGYGGWIGSNDKDATASYKEIAELYKSKDPRFEKYTMDMTTGDMNGGSDMASFLPLDKKVSFGAGSGCVEYHTHMDDINHINPESEAYFGEIFGTYAYYLAENDGAGPLF
jgi:hypothetical protein